MDPVQKKKKLGGWQDGSSTEIPATPAAANNMNIIRGRKTIVGKAMENPCSSYWPSNGIRICIATIETIL